MTYEIKDNPVHGKMLAQDGKIIITDHDTAMKLAERFNAQLVKSHSNRYMIQLPYTAKSIEECDCQSGQLQPDTYNQYPDHEVQMARQELYRTAKLAIMTHELLKQVGERQGLEGWVQSKLTRAADYIETVFDYLDYEMRYPSEMYNEANLNPGGSAQATPGTTPAGQQNLQPGQAPIPPADGKSQTPGMVKMAKVDMNGKIQGMPIMVPQNSIKSKQQAGFRVVGESATGGASSAGGMASSTGFGNGFLNGGPGAISRRPKKKRTTESKVEVNFTADDIKRMEGMRDILKMKQYAKQLIATPSEKPIKPQKIAWFNHVIDGKKDPMQLIKFMYDMLLGGEGKAVLGTRYSMEPNNYRKVFNDITTEAWDMLDPSKPYGLANPRILTVGDDPQGIADFAITGKNVLSIRPFNANQWNNIQQDARNHGYMLKYTGTNPEKATVANTGDAPRLGYNMRGNKLESVAEGANTLFAVKVVDPKTGNEKTMEISALTASEAKSKVAGKTVEVDGEKKHYKVISVKSAWNDSVDEANYQGWVSNPQAKIASRFAHDPDRAAVNYKPNKYDPETGLGGYVANRASTNEKSNIMLQLNANLDSAYSKPIRFDDGSQVKIGPNIARKALNKLNSMRPVQRHGAVKSIVASKDAFVSFVKDSSEGVEEGWKSAATGAALLGLGAMGAGGQAQAANMNKAGVTNMKAPVHTTQAVKHEQLKRYPTDPRPDLKLGSIEDMFFNGNTNHDREIRFLNYETDSDAKGMSPQQWSDAQGPKNSPMKTLTPDQQAARKKIPLRTANWHPDDDNMPQSKFESKDKTGPKFTGYWKGKNKGKPGNKMVGDA